MIIWEPIFLERETWKEKLKKKEETPRKGRTPERWLASLSPKPLGTEFQFSLRIGRTHLLFLLPKFALFWFCFFKNASLVFQKLRAGLMSVWPPWKWWGPMGALSTCKGKCGDPSVIRGGVSHTETPAEEKRGHGTQHLGLKVGVVVARRREGSTEPQAITSLLRVSCMWQWTLKILSQRNFNEIVEGENVNAERWERRHWAQIIF